MYCARTSESVCNCRVARWLRFTASGTPRAMSTTMRTYAKARTSLERTFVSTS